MSTTALSPTVANKLRRVGRRRVFFLVLRGICAVVLAFLICMAIVAAIDWYWVLSDTTRWVLSTAAYALTAIALWFTCLRKLFSPPGTEEIATHVEEAEPTVRENLLSAVELATDDPATVNDSPVFRGLLQDKVSQQMSGVRVPKVLPFGMLAKWLVPAAMLIGGVAFLLASPDGRFRTLAQRALMPGANIERVSRIKVEILQPTPKSLTVATDETVAVVIAVSGGDVDEVTLETFQADGEPRQQIMRSRTETEFAANIHVEADTEYRILAGDAVTKRYTIESKDRPRVVAFYKTYQYPEYSGLESKHLTENTGDIVVLEGTQAQLALELDQAVSTAELRINGRTADEFTTIPLEKNDDNKWCATVPVEETAIYKVHLVAEETGFQNLFAPRYEIRPIADLIPRAGFVDQVETDMLLPPNDIVALKAMGEDDLPLATLEQEISVNGLEWQVVPLEVVASTIEQPEDQSTGSAAHRVDAGWDWDLLNLKLQTGDQVTTRVVATDRKGNRGESVPIRIVVSAPEFDPQRHTIMERKAQLFDDLARLDKTAKEHQNAAHEIIKRLRDGNQSEDKQSLDRTTLADHARKLREASSDVLDQVTEVTREMPPGADAYDLYMTGRVIARLQQEHMNRPAYLVKAMQHAKDDTQRNSDLDQIKRAFDRAADDADRAAHHYQYLMTHNVLAALAADFDALFRQQRLVVNSPTQTWSRLVRQQTLVNSQLGVVERLMKNQQSRLAGNIQRRVRQQLDWTRLQRANLERAMESEDNLKELQQVAKGLYKELTYRRRTMDFDGSLPSRITQTWRDFDHRSSIISEPLTLASNAIRDEVKNTIAATKAEDSNKATESTRAATRFAIETDLLHRDSLEQIRIRRDLTQARQDSDPQFAYDAGLTNRAVTSLLNQHRQAEPEESIVPNAFNEITLAFRILEAGHDLTNVQIALGNLLELERWNSQTFASGIDHPRQWDLVNKGLEQASNRLKQAGIDREITGRVDQVRWSQPMGEANQRIGQRRWKKDAMVSAVTPLIDLSERLKEATNSLKPVMAEARATIARYAPTIPEMAEQLAQRLREQEKQTTQVADAVEKQPEDKQQDDPAREGSEPQPADEPKLADVQDEQQRINRQIDDLFEALIEDANKRDLLDQEQRERARDADDSIAMIREPAEQAKQALRQAEENPAAEQQAKELAKAAEQQEKTAQALDKVAKHFDAMKKGEDLAKTRAQLREAERELGIARQMDQKFDPAQQLAEQAQADPAEQLAKLEEELTQNPAMQKALSEIAKNTVQEAKNALEDAANKEQAVQKANERSDQKFLEKKREIAKQIRELGQKTNQIAQTAQQANQSSAQAKTPEAQKKFADAQNKLIQAAQKAQQANEGELLAQLADRLKDTQQAIDEANKQLKSGEQEAAEAKDKKIFDNDRDRQSAQKQQEAQRKRFLDQKKRLADQVKRNAEQQERNAQRNVQNQERLVKNADRQIQQAKKQLKRQPDSKGLQNNVKRAEARKQDALKKVDEAKAQLNEARKITQKARDQRNELNKASTPALDKQNPAAQAAEAYANEAAQETDQLKKTAEELAKNLDIGKQLTPKKAQLQQAKGQQERVTRDVKQVAENIDRAARHERRLENAEVAKSLAEAAKGVEDVANNEAKQAGQQLAAAERAAGDPQKPGEGDNKPAIVANEKLADAEQAIAAQAESLGEALAASQEAEAAAAQAGEAGSESGQPEQGSPGQPQQGSPANQQGQPGQRPKSFTPAEAAAGRQLAQRLDALDQQMQAAQSGKPSIPGLAQAAQAQQQRMAAARSKQQQQSALASNSPPSEGEESKGEPKYDGELGRLVAGPVNRKENKDWGKLREQAAEDLTKGRREAVSEEYRKSVEAYFKVLAERARRSK